MKVAIDCGFLPSQLGQVHYEYGLLQWKLLSKVFAQATQKMFQSLGISYPDLVLISLGSYGVYGACSGETFCSLFMHTLIVITAIIMGKTTSNRIALRMMPISMRFSSCLYSKQPAYLLALPACTWMGYDLKKGHGKGLESLDTHFDDISLVI